MKIEFVHTGGPYGDCTSHYDVRIPEGTTVGEFIDYIVKNYSVTHGEWGSFWVRKRENNFQGLGLISYDRGKTYFTKETWRTPREPCESRLADLSNRVITRVRANGGWSAMDYYLYLEEATNE